MAEESGGARRPGRPKGALNKRTLAIREVVRLNQNGNRSPKDVMLFLMNKYFDAKQYEDAARIANMVAPYVHAKLSNSTVSVIPAPSEMTDEQLAAAIKDAEDAAILDESSGALRGATGTRH